MSTEEHKALIRRWFEQINTGEIGVVEQFIDALGLLQQLGAIPAPEQAPADVH